MTRFKLLEGKHFLSDGKIVNAGEVFMACDAPDLQQLDPRRFVKVDESGNPIPGGPQAPRSRVIPMETPIQNQTRD